MPVDLLRQIKPIKSTTDVHKLSECRQQVNGKYIHSRPKDVYEGKETILLINQDGGRNRFVPRKEPGEPPIIFSETEFRRIQKSALRMTKEEKNRVDMQMREEKLKLKNESNERTKRLINAKLAQMSKPGTRLYKEEAEAADRSQYVLQRAFELRQEQEDEVKHANSVILAAKCLSIREAQILEKQLIDKELKDHEYKLDMMMEDERQKALKNEEELKEKRRKMNHRHVNEVSQQIRDNEVQRDLEFQRKQEESRNISRAVIAMQRDELRQNKEKKLARQKAREEFRKANEQIAQFKIVQNEENRIANFKIQEFMRKKAEREAAYEAEMERIKLEKNLELVRLQAQQQRAIDIQAVNDELRAQRVQEECERIWREKERANALKRKMDLENLIKARQKQVEDIQRTQALEIERDREEFYRIAKIQKQLYDEEVEKRRKKREAALKHREDLVRQINDKELERLECQKQKFEEGHTLSMEKQLRSLNIKRAILTKVEKLRENNVPDRVVGDIQRQLKLR